MVLLFFVLFRKKYFSVFLVNPIASQYHAQPHQSQSQPHQQPHENYSLHYQESFNQVNFSSNNFPQSNLYHQPMSQNHQNENYQNPMQNTVQQSYQLHQQQINLIHQDATVQQQHNQYHQQPTTNANQFMDNSGTNMNVAGTSSYHQPQQDMNSMMMASTSGTQLQQNLFANQPGQVSVFFFALSLEQAFDP